MGTLLFIKSLRGVFILLEITYSAYKKDGVFSIKGSLGNILRGITSSFLQKELYVIYVYFSMYYASLHFQNTLTTNFTFIKFFSCLLLLDFFGYLMHRAHHKFSILWATHFTHHSDRKVNLSTYLRASWIEQVYYFIPILPILLLLGFRLDLIMFASSVIGFYSFFCHNHYVNLPRFFDYIFITPENHRVHHDEHIENQNSNFGNLFSIWDRMFGTFNKKKAGNTFGIKGYRQDNFIKMETDPIIEYFKSFKKR